ncbi:MAG: hypothetical protein ACREI9_16130, partial [Nitrospiraceae bacterium]
RVARSCSGHVQEDVGERRGREGRVTILVGPHWIVVCDGYTDTVYYIDGGSTRAPYCIHNNDVRAWLQQDDKNKKAGEGS